MLVGFVVIALLMGVVGFVQIRTGRQVSQQLDTIDRLSDAQAALINPAVHEIGHLSVIVEQTYSTLLEYASIKVDESDRETPDPEEEERATSQGLGENESSSDGETPEVGHAEQQEKLTNIDPVPTPALGELIDDLGHAHEAPLAVAEQSDLISEIGNRLSGDADTSMRLSVLHREFEAGLTQLDAAADIDPLVVEEISHIAGELKPVQEIHAPADRLYGEHFQTLEALVHDGQHEAAKQFVRTTMIGEVEGIRAVLNSIHSHLDEEQTHSAAIVEQSIHDAAAAAAAAGEALAVGIVAAMILAIGMGVFVSRSVARPLRELQFVAAQIIAGDYTKRAEVRGRDEIAELAGSFNAMTESLVEAQRLPKNILRSMRDSLFVVDTKGKITEANAAALEMLGYTKEELVGQPISRVFGKIGGSVNPAARGADEKQKLRKKVIRYIPDPQQEHEEEEGDDEPNKTKQA